MKMPDEWLKEREQNKLRWFCDNVHAVMFISDFMNIIELWDDLIDKDVSLTDEDINDGFERMMIGLNINPFFVTNRNHLMPLIIHTINAYHDSEILKKGNKREMFLAFSLRNFGLELYQACAFITGGYEHLRKVSPEIRSFFCFEDYDEWVKENG
jgi:hypothetical protein